MQTLFFYDLETSGLSPREQRIMQFAGQRTDLDLKPIGEPYNILLKLSDDVLPDPEAVLVTGITPQAANTDGITEAEFLRTFQKEIAVPDTIFVGYNTVRFDDEFMRFLHYRNFYDAYEWHWVDGKSRWDLLDTIRMTRALRPDGIKWPVDSTGKATNRLELLTSINGLDHANAHDALNDVQATIAVARLVKEKQPKLFSYLLEMRDKKKVETLVTTGAPFVYTSGKYSSDTEKTTIGLYLCPNPKTGALIYDLRQDPTAWFDKSPAQLAEAWKWKKDSTEPRLPVKTMQYNRCPAIAPLTVLDDDSKQRLKLDMDAVKRHEQLIRNHPEFCDQVHHAAEILNKQQQTAFLANEQLVDAQLYDGFFGPQDKNAMRAVVSSDGESLSGFEDNFKDSRLSALLPLYKARNFPGSLSEEEQQAWEQYRTTKLLGGGESSRAANFFKRLAELSDQPRLTDSQRYLLEELQLYGQSILPTGD